MEKKLLNSDLGLNRFKAINRYADNLLKEQATPPPPADPNAIPPPPAGGEGEIPPPPGGEVPPPPGGEAPLPPTDETGADEIAPDTGESPEVEPTESDDTTEEIDITDLVNMTKSIKKQLDTAGSQQDTGATEKMDALFSKLAELEGKLGEMDNVLAKIDQLGAQIQDVKPKTPVEKLEMRSLDSYPFSKKPDEFFQEKQDEMKRSGKNEYVLTKGDVENYGKYDVMKSFNPQSDNNGQF